MIFSLKNIGVISSADIEVKGLTILGGHNDIGKSFIGRVIFSVIQTINGVEEKAFHEKVDRIDDEIERLYSLIRTRGKFDRPIRDVFNVSDVFKKVLDLSFPINKDKLALYLEELRNSLVNLLINNNLEENTQLIEQITERIDKILQVSVDSPSKESLLPTFFDRVIKNEFADQISKYNSKSSIICREGDTSLLEIQINENNLVEKLQLTDSVFFTDATIIETPVIMQYASHLTSELAFGFGRASLFSKRNISRHRDLPGHISDLLQKIREVDELYAPHLTDTYSFISEIINGDVSFDKNDDSFYYNKSNSLKIKPINIATGIKSLGLIQLLLKSGNINERSLLIVDEPEVHLHPKWQKEYAKLLVKLAKNNIPIIVSSHSPYMMKAFKVYSEKYNVSDITKFYFGEKTKDDVCYKDVTEDLEPIFKILAEPMQDLTFES